jgi:hypothetical protein
MFMMMLGSASGNTLAVGTVTGSFVNWRSRKAETRTVRDCNVHDDDWVRIRKHFCGGYCHRLLRELAEQESGNSYRQGLSLESFIQLIFCST